MSGTARQTAKVLGHYLRPQRGRVAVLAVALLAGSALPLVGPQLLRSFIDAAKAGRPDRVLIMLALAYLGFAFGAQAVGVIATWVSEKVGWTSTNALRSDLARHALNLDMGYHNSHTPGEMIERVDGDVTALSNFFSAFTISILGSMLMLVGILILTAREDWRVGALMTVFVVISLFVMVQLRRVSLPDSHAHRERSAHLFGFIEERLAGTDDIRANGAGLHVMRGMAEASRSYVQTGVRAEQTGIRIWVASMVLYVISMALVLAAGAWLFAHGQITIGTVFLLFQYMLMLDGPITSIAAQLKDFQRAGAGIIRVRELFALRSTIVDGTCELPSGALSVEFDNVTFGYGDDEPVVDAINISLAPGEVTGILGRTGSGKTTLTRLLLRLYDVESGAVRVGGVDVRDVRRAALRRAIGVVTQDVQLFEGTVRDNLTLFDANVTDERILEVIDEVGMRGWLESLGNGLETSLVSAGGGLSAGQAQLLAFARVFLRDPQIVILDEATSRLDPSTEALISRAVTRMLSGRTAIVIAHRLATLSKVDSIVVMESGHVVEAGRRQDLVEDDQSRFATLLAAGAQEVSA